MAARHFHATKSPGIILSGRHLSLLYHLISLLVSPPHTYAVFVIDLDGRFDAARLTCSASDLSHVYVQTPAREAAATPDRLRGLVGDAEAFMVYSSGARASAGRVWWGTVVVGGFGAGDVAAGWKGWCRVERARVAGFAAGVSGEEALGQREGRRRAVEEAGWVVLSEWGGFVFEEGVRAAVQGG